MALSESLRKQLVDIVESKGWSSKANCCHRRSDHLRMPQFG